MTQQLVAKIDSLQHSNSVMQNQLNSAKLECQELAAQVDKLNTLTQTLNLQLSNAETQLSAQLEQYTTYVHKHTQDVAALRQKLAQRDQEYTDQQKQIGQVKSELILKQKELNELSQKHFQLKSLSDQQQTAVGKLESTNKIALNQISELEHQISSLNANLISVQSSLANFKLAAEQDKLQLNSVIESEKSQKGQLQVKVTAQEHELTLFRQSFTQYQQESSKLHNLMTDYESKNALLHSENETKSLELHRASLEAERLRAMINQVQKAPERDYDDEQVANIARLKSKYLEQGNLIKSLEIKLKAAETRATLADKRRAAAEDMMKQRQQVYSSIIETQQDIQISALQQSQSQMSNEELTLHNQQLQQTIKKQKQDFKRIFNELNATGRANIINEETKIDFGSELQEIRQRFQAELDSKTFENSELRSQLLLLKNTQNVQPQSIQESFQEIQKLNQQILVLSNSKRQSDQQIQSLQSETKCLSEAYEELKIVNNELIQKFQSVSNEVQTQAQQLIVMVPRQQLMQSEQLVSEQLRQMQAMQSELKSIETENMQLKFKQNNQEVEIHNLQNQKKVYQQGDLKMQLALQHMENQIQWHKDLNKQQAEHKCEDQAKEVIEQVVNEQKAVLEQREQLISNLQTVIAELQALNDSQLQNHKQDVALLEQQIESEQINHRNQVQIQNEQVAKLQSQIETLKAEINEINKRDDQLPVSESPDIDKLLQENFDLTQQVSRLHSQLSSSVIESKLKENILQSEISQLRKEVDKLQQETKSSFAMKPATQDGSQKLRDEIYNLQIQNKQLRDQIDQANFERDKAKKDLEFELNHSGYKHQNEQLTMQVSELELTNAQAQSELARTQQQLTQVQAETSRLKEQAENNSKQSKQLESELVQSKELYEKIRIQKITNDKGFQSLRTDFNNLKQEQINCKNQLEAKSEEVLKLATELQKSKEDLEAKSVLQISSSEQVLLQEQLTTFKETIDLLKLQVAADNKEPMTTNQMFAMMMNALNRAKAVIEKIAAQSQEVVGQKRRRIV